MKRTCYYTVLIRTTSFQVRYIVSPSYEQQEFNGAFRDPGEASREFEAAMGEGVSLTHLSPAKFEQKEREIASVRQRLAGWNAMSRPLPPSGGAA